jgi:hypothetical protein
VHAATLVVTDPDLQMLPRCLWRDGPLSDADIRTCRAGRVRWPSVRVQCLCLRRTSVFEHRPQPLVAGRACGVRTWTVPISLRRNLTLWAP